MVNGLILTTLSFVTIAIGACNLFQKDNLFHDNRSCTLVGCDTVYTLHVGIDFASVRYSMHMFIIVREAQCKEKWNGKIYYHSFYIIANK